MAASPKLCPKEGHGLGNGLKARMDSSFPGSGCSSQVACCAANPLCSPGFCLKAVPGPYHQGLLFGVIFFKD